jgi:glutathione S-transferase
MTLTLTYFDARGRAEPIRLLLAYAGVAFEDRGLSFPQWQEHKAATPLGQLPYLTEERDGRAVTIPQSMAIVRHLAREHGLDGKTEPERVAADVAAETAVDLRGALTRLRFSPAWQDEAQKAQFAAETAPMHLARLDTLLGDRTWFAAAAPTYADLVILDTLDGLLLHWPTILAAHPRLAAFRERALGLPQLAKYLATRRAA